MSICNVNIGTGDVYHFSVDFYLRGFIPFRFIRDYDSGRSEDSAVGQRWRHNQDYRLVLEQQRAIYFAPDGSRLEVPHPDHPPASEDKPGLKTLREGTAVLLSDPQNTVYRFEPFNPRDTTLRIKSYTDPRGNRLEYNYYSD